MSSSLKTGKEINGSYQDTSSERERETPTHHRQNTVTCYYAPSRCIRVSFTTSCSRRTVGDIKSLRLLLACFVSSNLVVDKSSFVFRESRAGSSRVDLGLAEMGRKAGVIALFDVDGTLTPARKVAASYLTFPQFWSWCCGFPFFHKNYCCENSCGEWISRFVRSGYEQVGDSTVTLAVLKSAEAGILQKLLNNYGVKICWFLFIYSFVLSCFVCVRFWPGDVSILLLWWQEHVGCSSVVFVRGNCVFEQCFGLVLLWWRLGRNAESYAADGGTIRRGPNVSSTRNWLLIDGEQGKYTCGEIWGSDNLWRTKIFLGGILGRVLFSRLNSFFGGDMSWVTGGVPGDGEVSSGASQGIDFSVN